MSMKQKPDARSIAAYVLDRVHAEQAFAAPVLDAALERYPEIDPRDRALATDLVYGSLRTAPYLEARLARLARHGIDKLDPAVLSRLVVGAYQILFLDRVPAFAAVSEAVNAVTELRGSKLGAFTNAVLRRLAKEATTGPPIGRAPKASGPTDKRALLETAVRESIAPWLREALARTLGSEGADAFIMELAAAPLDLRARRGDDREALIGQLRGALPQADVTAGRVSPLAIKLRGARDGRRLDLVKNGTLAVQEEGAQLVALSLGAKPGDIVLDACAGRGNKTAILAEHVGSTGAVDAADQHPQKLARLNSELGALRLQARACYAVDWLVGTGDVPNDYDRVLVDAPCSGVGTLRRRPDLGTRRHPKSLAELAALQVDLLARAAGRVKEGGTVVYAVCSVLREEGEDVVRAVLERAPFLRPAPFAGEPARHLAGPGSVLRLTPYEHQTDGYFLASFVRQG
jgi:16S rRNA (cytosine967-C5)-methyltransferase